MHTKLTFPIPEDRERRCFKEQDTMDMGITVLKRLEDPATGNVAKLLANVRHEPIEPNSNVAPSFSKRATLNIISQRHPQSPRLLSPAILRIEENQFISSRGEILKSTIDPPAINVVTSLGTLHRKDLVLGAIPTRENHILDFRHPLDIPLLNLGN